MRNYIGSFRQDILQALGISLNEWLLLDQFMIYSRSNTMQKKYKDGKDYVYIKYSKVMSDLPILNITDRTYRKYVQHLTQSSLIEKYSDNSSELYIHLNLDLLLKEARYIEFETPESPMRLFQGEENNSRIIISPGIYEIFNNDLNETVKLAIKTIGVKKLKLLFIDHLKCQLGTENPALIGVFDRVEFNISINKVIQIKSIHASMDALYNLSSKIFRSLSFSLLHMEQLYKKSYTQ